MVGVKMSRDSMPNAPYKEEEEKDWKRKGCVNSRKSAAARRKSKNQGPTAAQEEINRGRRLALIDKLQTLGSHLRAKKANTCSGHPSVSSDRILPGCGKW